MSLVQQQILDSMRETLDETSNAAGNEQTAQALLLQMSLELADICQVYRWPANVQICLMYAIQNLCT